ncbi:MAG: glucosaminidase domain-containing protein [Psychroflexus sp.]
MNLKSLFYILIILILASCGSKRKAAQQTNSRQQAQVDRQTSQQRDTSMKNSEDDYHIETESAEKTDSKIDRSKMSAVELYIYDYAEIAKEEMRLYGIPASITLSQGILESGSGTGPLTSKSNNHFGIKCNGWKGEKVYHDDDEAQECFRKYNDAKYSFRDHSLFLFERQRYAFLFDYDSDDYKAWARGLKRAGYATDPRYPNKLISLIERYNLDDYDREILNGNSSSLPKPAKTAENYELYSVKKGDTLYNISERFDLTIEELKLINKLKSNNIQIGQKLKVKN